MSALERRSSTQAPAGAAQRKLGELVLSHILCHPILSHREALSAIADNLKERRRELGLLVSDRS
jgi:hypothetical protein